LLPFSRHGQPINAASLNRQTGTQLPRGNKQTMESRMAEILRIRWPSFPGLGQRTEERFVSVADPQARFGGEPIQAPQPGGGGFQARVVEDLRLFAWLRFRVLRLPLMAVPKPDALVALTLGGQAQPHSFLQQFKNELRH